MKAPKSKSDIRENIRDLGGDDNDYDLVASIDDSGSEFEFDGAAASNGKLANDVAAMWAELSKANSATKNPAAKSAETSKSSEVSSAATKKANKKAAGSPKDQPRAPEAVSKGGKDTKGKSNSKQSPRDANAVKSSSATNNTAPVPKKVRREWEQYLSSIPTPSELVFKDDDDWAGLAGAVTSERKEPVPSEFVLSLKTQARKLLDAENALFFKERVQDRDFKGSLDFLKNGTFSDQLGTLSILATESPLHSMRFLNDLVSKCEIKNRESACKALEVTKDLLVSHVFPDRRLQWFKDQQIAIGASAQQLIAWSFEDFLKQQFMRLLQVMEKLLSDTVESIRLRTLHCVFDFFRLKPEQEANLLRLGLNKLGDPSGKLSSRVKKLVMDALQVHPGMKTIVASVTVEVLSRNNDYRTRYYAVDTLSEFILSSQEPALANQLIYIYLDIFERLLNESKNGLDAKDEKAPTRGKPKSGKRFRAKRGKKGGFSQAKTDANEAETQQYARLVSKLFTGLNRAFPYSKLESNVFTKYVDTLYQMSHSPNVGTFIEALSFIFQLTKSMNKGVDGRYFRTLYESLLDQRITHSSKLAKYIHLLIKSVAELRPESEVARATALAKRMLQVASNWSDVGGVASLIHSASLTPHTSRLLEFNPSEFEYDPKQRDPSYARAEFSQAWELLLLENHFHPTVSLYASNLLATDDSRQALDLPDIEQYSVNNFLSKWSYKKPKGRDATRGSSIFQPLSGFTDLNLGIKQERGSVSSEPVQMQDWKSKKASQVAPDEQFLYDYFSQLPEKAAKPSKEVANQKKADDDDDDDEEDESIDEDEISSAMARSGPADLDGVGLDASDFDSDGDLDDDLAAAFDDSDSDLDGDNGVSEADDADDADGADGVDSEQGDDEDDFADFDGPGIDSEAEAPEEGESEDGRKNRKRKWNALPTFLDADAFEELYSKEESSKKDEAPIKKRR